MVCQICPHEKRRDIDRDLVLGQPERGIAGRYGIAKSSVHRHRSCIADKLAAADKRIAGRIANRVIALIEQLEAMAKEAHDAKAAAAFLAAVRELRPTYELGAKLNGEMQAATVQAFLAAMGVQSEAEVREALHVTRAAQAPSLEECREEWAALGKLVLTEKPEWRDGMLAQMFGLRSAAVLVESTNGHANGNGAHQ